MWITAFFVQIKFINFNLVMKEIFKFFVFCLHSKVIFNKNF